MVISIGMAIWDIQLCYFFQLRIQLVCGFDFWFSMDISVRIYHGSSWLTTHAASSDLACRRSCRSCCALFFVCLRFFLASWKLEYIVLLSHESVCTGIDWPGNSFVFCRILVTTSDLSWLFRGSEFFTFYKERVRIATVSVGDQGYVNRVFIILFSAWIIPFVMAASSLFIITMSVGCRVLFFILLLILLVFFTTLFVSTNFCNSVLYVDILSGDLVDKMRDVNDD